MERVTVYLNEIPVLVMPWMEVRHVLYSRQIPFEERDAVISGLKIIQDSNKNQVLLESKIVQGEHYFTVEASSNPNSSLSVNLPDLSQLMKSIKLCGFGKSSDEV